MAVMGVIGHANILFQIQIIRISERWSRNKGGITTSKTDYIKVAEQRRRRASAQDYILKGPRPETWSAVMPAYCYTVLCPVPELRVNTGGQIGGDDNQK